MGSTLVLPQARSLLILLQIRAGPTKITNCLLLGQFKYNKLFVFFSTGFSTSWSYSANESFGWKLFVWNWSTIFISNCGARGYTTLFSCRYWRGRESLDCRHESCIQAKRSMAWNEYTKFTIATEQYSTSRLLWISFEIGQSMENMVQAILCAQRCLPIFLFGWK